MAHGAFVLLSFVVLLSRAASADASRWPQGAGSKSCGEVAGSWAQTGEVWEIGQGGAPQQSEPGQEEAWHSPPLGFRAHGDGKSRVMFEEDGRYLHITGDEAGTGAGVTLYDVSSKPANLEYIYPGGLTDALALVIAGRRAGEFVRDLFFCQSKQWSAYKDTAKIPANDPLYAAQGFVRAHEDLQVFFGTGDYPLSSRPLDHFQEAAILSGILGVWVMADHYHTMPSRRNTAFRIEDEAWVHLSGKAETVSMFMPQDLRAGAQLAFTTPRWAPDHELMRELATLKLPPKYQPAGASLLRAYAAGDYDSLAALHEHPDNKKQYGRHLGPFVKRCYEDMMQNKGYEQQRFRRNQDDFYQVGLYSIATPSLGRAIG